MSPCIRLLAAAVWCWLVTAVNGQEPVSDQDAPPVIVAPTLESPLEADRTMVWTGAFHACWSELRQLWKGAELTLQPESPLASQMNAWPHAPADFMPKESFLAGAGRMADRDGIERIQKDIERQFGARFEELDAFAARKDLEHDAWFTCCWLRRELAFDPVFARSQHRGLSFRNGGGETHVTFFGTEGTDLARYRDVVRVLLARNDATVISIIPKGGVDELCLAMGLRTTEGRPVATLAEAVAALDALRKTPGPAQEAGLREGDLLEIPIVRLEAMNSFLPELRGSFQVPGEKRAQHFEEVWEKVFFELDETGAKVEARGFGAGFGGEPPRPPHQRLLSFDGPFFIVGWMKGAPSPYFAAHIAEPSVMVPSSFGSPYVMLPPQFRSRCSSAERLGKLKEAGGSADMERSLSMALEWLKTNQKVLHEWGDTHPKAHTALPLLAFLARCETTASPFYGDTVLKAQIRLVELSALDSGIQVTALTTLALAESFIFARTASQAVPGLRQAMEEQARRLIAPQREDGGWLEDSAAPAEKPSDVTLSAWGLHALETLRRTSLRIDKLQPALDKARKLAAPKAKDGLAWEKSESLQDWFFTSRAPAFQGGDAFRAWNRGNVAKLLKAQASSGSWPSTGPATVLFTDDNLTAHDRELQLTCIAVLVLSAPYREVLPPSGKSPVASPASDSCPGTSGGASAKSSPNKSR